MTLENCCTSQPKTCEDNYWMRGRHLFYWIQQTELFAICGHRIQNEEESDVFVGMEVEKRIVYL